MDYGMYNALIFFFIFLQDTNHIHIYLFEICCNTQRKLKRIGKCNQIKNYVITILFL